MQTPNRSSLIAFSLLTIFSFFLLYYFSPSFKPIKSKALSTKPLQLLECQSRIIELMLKEEDRNIDESEELLFYQKNFPTYRQHLFDLMNNKNIGREYKIIVLAFIVQSNASAPDFRKYAYQLFDPKETFFYTIYIKFFGQNGTTEDLPFLTAFLFGDNSSHVRESAYSLQCIGDSNTLHVFDLWIHKNQGIDSTFSFKYVSAQRKQLASRISSK